MSHRKIGQPETPPAASRFTVSAVRDVDNWELWDGIVTAPDQGVVYVAALNCRSESAAVRLAESWVDRYATKTDSERLRLLGWRTR